jgi:hypothetical protein
MTLPTLTLVRKQLFRGRGGNRVRATVRVTFGAGALAGGYTNTVGFCGDQTNPNDGIDINSVLPDKINVLEGRIESPRVIALTTLTNMVHGFAGTTGILDYAGLTVSNVNSTKKLFVKLYGLVAAGPTFEDAATQAGPPSVITGGTFTVRLDYTPVSGAEG